MTDYTPTTDEVRSWVCACIAGEDCVPREEFDRWLAAHDKDVLEKATERATRIANKPSAGLAHVIAAINGESEQA